MVQPKKLIEVAMPIKEISAESVRDKSIRHGHISTLHLWWARRPLPVCRAVVFASLVPDPLDENCPQAFRDAVDILLGKVNNAGDPYKPYDDIPYTAAYDKMEDNLRNRLLMFIGKFSDKYISNERIGKKTDSKDQLSDASLIKWDNKNNEDIITIARKLIWVSHNSSTGLDAKSLLDEFGKFYKAIKVAESELYNLVDRHIESSEVRKKEGNLINAINNFLDKMPSVFDPFAGGGAIPLEAARLGCRSYGNDINPVAYIIQKGSLEFPQKYGKPIIYSKSQFIKLYGEEEYNKLPNEWKVIHNGDVVRIRIPNQLSFDVEFFGKSILSSTEKEIGKYYPKNKNGLKPSAYYWVRIGTCSNPSCRAEVPLLRQFNLNNAKQGRVYLHPIIQDKSIHFEIRKGSYDKVGWMSSKSLKCPFCGSTTPVDEIKEQSKSGKLKQSILAVIEEGTGNKSYRLPSDNEIKMSIVDSSLLNKVIIPNEDMLQIPDLVSGRGWGIHKWSQMFSNRQLLSLQTIISKINDLKQVLNTKENDYHKAIITYLGILINRITPRFNMFTLWNTAAETLEHIFGRQAIPMVFDYPESNIFSSAGGSAQSQIGWITKYIESESNSEFYSECINAASGDKTQFEPKTLTCVVTDPPYYDAIAYADLSDFFYVWYKRILADVYQLNFATPQTPKTEECTALKHHHDGSAKKANQHFEQKLSQIFDAIEQQTSELVSIMFAHQSTEAWTTLCNSILGSRMNITGSWAIDTERSSAGVKTDKAFLSSSVTVASRPIKQAGIGEFKDVRKSIGYYIEQQVEELFKLGFRGADLLTACFGKTVSEFGRYERVEKADGSEVTVNELLNMARESAFNALLKGFDGDDFTKFYIGWLQLFGFTESEFDDAAKFARVGLTINVSDLFTHNLFIKNGNKQVLAGYKERLSINHRIGEGIHSFIIDTVHKAMFLYEGANRKALLEYIAKVAQSPDNSFWRVITSLCEVLPQGSDDYKQATGLLLNKESLIRECRNLQQIADTEPELF